MIAWWAVWEGRESDYGFARTEGVESSCAIVEAFVVTRPASRRACIPTMYCSSDLTTYHSRRRFKVLPFHIAPPLPLTKSNTKQSRARIKE